MGGLLRGYVRVVDGIAEVTGWVSQMAVILTVIIGFYNVIARYLGQLMGMKLASNAFLEVQWYLFSLVFLLGFNYILKHGINVRVDFLYANWPRARQATIDFWGNIIFMIPFAIIGIWVTVKPVITSWGRQANGNWGKWEISGNAGGLPLAPLKSLIIVGFVLLLLQIIAEVIKLYPIMRGSEPLVEEEIIEAPLRIE